jgi:hypothetical protein
VVLTPHLTAPLADDRHPSDLSILQSGTYNLGFVAMRRCDDTARLLRWWQGKLERDCVVDIPRGLFTDQKWMDLVPGFCARTVVERHPGWNVAYWNLAHRQVDPGPSGFTVNGQPLFFFHFSGYDPRSASISKHQDRFTLAACTPATQQLFALYTERLARSRQGAVCRDALCLCQAGRWHAAAGLRAPCRAAPPGLEPPQAAAALGGRRAVRHRLPDAAGG